MQLITQWADAWGLPHEAVYGLMRLMGATCDAGTTGGLAESEVQLQVQYEATQKGLRLWRNNVGAGVLRDGSFLRWGLCNETKQMNQQLKSSDLIGIRPVTITQEMVGGRFGQFVAREVKRGGWRYAGSEHEQAQLRFLTLVQTLGGDAAFTSEVGSL
jgi:hypothetical protein